MRFLLAIFLLAITPLVQATSDETFSTLLNHIQTMHATFTQTTKNERSRTIQVSYGVIDLARGKALRFEVKKPIPSLILLNRNQVITYDPDLSQATIRRMAPDELTGMLLLSNNSMVLKKNYTVTPRTSQASEVMIFLLKPKRPGKTDFEQIEIGFEHNQLKTMRLFDRLHYTTEIIFNQVTINHPIAPAVFIFNPPKNTDMIMLHT